MSAGRVECRHPDTKGGVVFWLDQVGKGKSPADHLAFLLTKVPNPWPTDGWILYMEIRCQFCGETRLVEIQQSHRGQIVVCGCCGKEGPAAKAAAGLRT